MRTKNMKYTRINISSARKNPALNPKVSVIENLRPYSKNSRAFITFTNINKVGVNPQSNFSTPLGIYAYPLRAFWEDIENDKIPYAGDRPYVSLLLVKRNAKILNNNYSYNDLDQDLLKLYKFCEEKKLVESNREFVRLKDDAYEKYSFESTKPVFYIWAITRYIAFLLTLSGEDNINHITKWSSIFNKVLGYDGAIDFRGWGFIHPNEPKQALFLTKDSYQHVDMLLNKRYNNHSQHSKFMFDYEQIGYPSDFPEERIEIYEYITSLHPTLKNINGQSIITVYDKDKIKICSGNIFSNVKNIYFVGKDGQPKSISWNESPLPTTITGQKKYKIISCDLSNVVVNDCDIVRSIIRSGNFINCNFSKCKWINGTYNYDVFMFVNSKVSLEKLKKEYPEDKLTDLLYEMTIEQKGEELLGKKREDFTESDLKIIYKLAKKRLVAEIIDLSKLAEITKSDEVYYNK